MAVAFNKPPNLKYTDMCIYIDEHLNEIIETGSHPDVESKIFEYLYHVVYALACKGTFFPHKFDEYNDFALFSAGELFLCFRNKLRNEGKEVRGKIVQPIKSSLNFIKSVLFPLKDNYQKQTFSQIFNPEVGQDTSVIESDLRTSVQCEYLPEFETSLKEVFFDFKDKGYKHILLKTPYRRDKVFIKKLYISCMLTLLYQWTLPTKLNVKLSKKASNINYSVKYLENSEFQNEIILWHLDEKYHDYVKLMVNKIKHYITNEVEDTRSYYELGDETIDNILKTAYATYDDIEGDF